MRVLFVDDEPYLVRMAVATLRPDGYDMETAGDGAEALAKIQNNPPDLLVCDFMLPGMNGIELVKTMRNDTRFEKIKVILLINFAGENDLSSAYEREQEPNEFGINSVLRKPFTYAELLYAVNDVIGKPRK